MITVEKKIRTVSEAQEFVRAAETDFDSRMESLAAHIVNDDGVECVTLSGPTCSGKTTMAKKLTDVISANGKCAVILSIDDFFKEHSKLKKIGDRLDFDTVDAIDLAYFAMCTEKMLRGESTPLPRFDFQTGKRAEGKPYVHTPNDILIFEGIQAVYPEVLALLNGYRTKSLCIYVSEPLCVNGAVFTPEEIRLARRIVRDHKFRSASPEFTFHIWENVRANEDKNIYPFISGCDYTINSLMPYEPFMLAPYIVPLLEEIPSGSPYRTEAMALREKYRCVEDSPISADLLPESSLYHEFLG